LTRDELIKRLQETGSWISQVKARWVLDYDIIEIIAEDDAIIIELKLNANSPENRT